MATFTTECSGMKARRRLDLWDCNHHKENKQIQENN